MRDFAHECCGVFVAGSWTIVIFTLLLSWISSHRSDSVNP